MMHVMAKWADEGSEQDKKTYCKNMERLMNDFPCSSCKEHCLAYISRKNPRRYVNKDQGLFIWSWDFHNTVNLRLNKPILSLDDAIAIYSNTYVCAGCDSAFTSPHNTQISRRRYIPH